MDRPKKGSLLISDPHYAHASDSGLGRVIDVRLQNWGVQGSIPSKLGELAELRQLSLWGTNLRGPIPSSLANLSELLGLTLQYNQLTGEIPSILGNLPKLGQLRLDGNRLSGSIPPELGRLSDLWSLSLSDNRLTGEIPSRLGNLSKLHRLSLSRNRLSGSIPPELGRLSNLTSLDLGDNQLTGEIPPELGRLSKLEYLDLRQNDLEGQLPLDLTNLSSLKFLAVDGNDLCAPTEPRFRNWLVRRGVSGVKNCRLRLTYASVDGTQLILTYSGPVDPASRPDPDDFTVTVNGAARQIADVGIGVRAVTLRLASPVSSAEVVTVSYVPGEHPIQDRPWLPFEQTEAEGYVDREVANKTRPTPSTVHFQPRLLYASVDGTDLELAYSRPLDERSRPDTGDFTVKVNGAARRIAGVEIGGSKVMLRLARPVSSTDAVTVSYRPGAHPIRDKPRNEEPPVKESEAEGYVDRKVANRTLPTVSIDGGQATESSGAVGFTVRLSAASGREVTVRWSTTDGTAEAGADYVRSGGTLRFEPGRTFRRVSVALLADALEEADETFTVTLADPTNAALSVADATGTILGREAGSTPSDPVALEPDGDGGFALPEGAERDPTEAGTLAGTGESGSGSEGGPASEVPLDQPSVVSVDGEGNLYVLFARNHRILRINLSTGVVETVLDLSPQIVTVRRRVGGSAFGALPGSGDGWAPRAIEVPGAAAVTMAVDAGGSIYVADAGNHRVWRIDPSTGEPESLAGTGEPGYGGDGGPASEALLDSPGGLAVDAGGSIYVADSGNHRVRRIDAATGGIETLAGTGEPGYGGDGGPASEALLDSPGGLAVDAAGNVYVADAGNHRVRRIDATTGGIESLAGTGEPGYGGDGGPASEALLDSPGGLAVDAAANVYVADSGNHRVRRIDAATGGIETLAGTGEPGYGGDEGPASEALLNLPLGVAVDAAGKAYVADSLNHRVRVLEEGPSTVWVKLPLGASDSVVSLRVSEDGALLWPDRTPVLDGARFTATNGNEYVISKGAGGAVATYVPGLQSVDLGGGKTVSFTRDEAGTWYLGTQAAGRNARHIEDGREHLLEFADGQWRRALYTIRTVAGTDAVLDGIPAGEARLFHPCGVAIDVRGNLYVGDSGNRRVRRVDGLSGLIATYAGTGNWDSSGDGGLATESAVRACSLAADGQGNVYVADGFRVRRIDATGMIAAFAGTGRQGDSGDGGPAAAAQLGSIASVAVDTAGNVYVADRGNHRVRRIDATGTITTFAGTGERGYSGDGGPAAAAQLWSPYGVAADVAGNVYVAEAGNHRVRRIDAAGMIATFAGTGQRGFGGDGGPAAAARLWSPYGVAVDAAGNVYVADRGNHRVRRIDATGTITTFAGRGEPGYSGDGGPAAAAQLRSPHGVAMDAEGNAYVAEWGNHRVRRIDAAGTITTFVGTGEPFDEGDGGPAVAARFNRVEGVAVDALGNVYVADRSDHRVRRIDATGMITTFAGTGLPGYSGNDGPAAEAELAIPYGVAVDPSGFVYILDTGNHAVRAVSPAGTITTVAGTGRRGRETLPGGIVPESGTYELQLATPRGIAVDAAGQVYVSDTFNKRIVRVFPGSPPNVAVGNAPPAELENSPRPNALAVSQDGSIIVSDGGRLFGSAVGAPRLHSQFEAGVLFDNEARVTGLAIDESLEEPVVYVADPWKIRRIAGGTVTTIAERSADGGFGGDGGPGIGAGFSVGGIALDRSGKIWFTDPNSRRVRVLEPIPSAVP